MYKLSFLCKRMIKDTFSNSSNAKQMWSFTMKKYFVTPVIVAIYLNNALKSIQSTISCVVWLSRTGEWPLLFNSPRTGSCSPRVTGECNSRALDLHDFSNKVGGTHPWHCYVNCNLSICQKVRLWITIALAPSTILDWKNLSPWVKM